jgi:hypothetical protein
MRASEPIQPSRTTGVRLLTSEPRRFGTILLVFGIFGALIAGAVGLGFVGGAAGTSILAGRIHARALDMAERVNVLTASLDEIASKLENAGSTVAGPSFWATDASNTLDGVAATCDEIADEVDVEILGMHLFGGSAQKLRDIANRARSVADRAAAIATGAVGNANAINSLATDLRQVRGQLGGLAAAVDRSSQVVQLFAIGVFVIGVLVLWVGSAAALCAWVGWELRSAGRTNVGPVTT